MYRPDLSLKTAQMHTCICCLHLVRLCAPARPVPDYCSNAYMHVKEEPGSQRICDMTSLVFHRGRHRALMYVWLLLFTGRLNQPASLTINYLGPAWNEDTLIRLERFKHLSHTCNKVLTAQMFQPISKTPIYHPGVITQTITLGIRFTIPQDAMQKPL